MGARVLVGLAEAEGFYHIEGVISDLARSAMHLDGLGIENSDTVVDGLLRHLVRWSGADTAQFSLPSAAMPSDDGEAALARSLLKHRLLVDEGSHTNRLVHERVLYHWPEANSFIQRELPLHEAGAELSQIARRWAESGKDALHLTYASAFNADTACNILSLWGNRLHPFLARTVHERDATLRDFCLGILDGLCTPDHPMG